ncbi:MAG TPA: FliI/YscN family ATPase [Candidatus Binatia bacterium]|nr:FliI/YscN family ATPase [Candidatus Binatia bacterium]
MTGIDFASWHRTLEHADPVRRSGRVTDVIGLVIEGNGPGIPIGGVCAIERRNGRESVVAEVVGFRKDRVLLMPLGDVSGIEPGNRIVVRRLRPVVRTGRGLLGRVLDGLGQPIDGAGPLEVERQVALQGRAINPLEREPIRAPLELGIRAIDALLTCGRGQRVGIFAGSGVGKSSLLGMIARSTRAQANVVALIGERGREVREFLERDLGEEGRARSVVVAVTSDEPPLVRVRGALLAMAIAESFRDEGLDVLVMMDSLTRLAMAQREVGLSIGEPPSARGYTPSVFALLPRVLERAGATRAGSITGLYTVLVEGDDLNEPVADTARGLLDGHVVLSRALAEEGHFPAIDVLKSVSRLMPDVAPAEQVADAARVRGWLAAYRDAEDLIHIGAYAAGSSPRIDQAIARRAAIQSFLRQGLAERATMAEGTARLAALAREG